MLLRNTANTRAFDNGHYTIRITDVVVLGLSATDRYRILTRGTGLCRFARDGWQLGQHILCLIVLETCIGQCKLRHCLALLLRVGTSRYRQRSLRDGKGSRYISHIVVRNTSFGDENRIRTYRRGCCCFTSDFRHTFKSASLCGIFKHWVSLSILASDTCNAHNRWTYNCNGKRHFSISRTCRINP